MGIKGRRTFIKKATLSSLVTVGGVSAFASKHETETPYAGKLSIEGYIQGKAYAPLGTITIKGLPKGNIAVRDGLGREYLRKTAEGNLTFQIGGALGTHTVFAENKAGKIVDSISFLVNTKTSINDKQGLYKELMDILYFTMASEWGGETGTLRFNGKCYHTFVSWVRDHVHTMKAMKYFYPELKSGIELYSDSQRQDGMIWDNYTRRASGKNHWDMKFEYGNFILPVDNSTREFKRIPVENDVEYLFIEGIYYAWKATGDNAWMISLLDNALKAVQYSITDPYRWSEKYKLLKRGYTIDTWDFQSEYDAAITGHIMVIDKEKTKFNVMYGDNTGFAIGCDYLTEMLEAAGRKEEAKQISKLGKDIRERLDKLSWNGKFFTHQVPEDPTVVRDFGVDTNKQVSLSNAYSLNRGITHEQAVAIIKTYLEIKENKPKNAPAEWFAIYPPYEKGFGKNAEKWEYMNGGVLTILAGELAHGAFEHGYEQYGTDILKRILPLGKKHDNYLHCTFKGVSKEKPERKFTPISLKFIANADITGQGAKGVPGWTGEGENDLHEMPTGRQTFYDVPFDIVDPTSNGRRACLGISSEKGYDAHLSLPVFQNAKSIYFLHTRNTGIIAGTITLKYQDGTSYTEYVTQDKVDNWWMPTINKEVTKVAWRGANKQSTNVGVSIYGMNNPNPDKLIKSIDFDSDKTGVKWFILGVTLSDGPAFLSTEDISFGIPDKWGAAAVVYALVEGLAGVKDTGVAFNKALLAPRWAASEETEAEVTVKYEASQGYLTYKYKLDRAAKNITISFTGSAEETQVEILLPLEIPFPKVTLNGSAVPASLKKVQGSSYVVFPVKGSGVQNISIV